MGMGSRNISISESAYLRLRRARRHPRESFSEVIRRGHWDDGEPTARAWLDNFEAAPLISAAVLDALEADQKADRPPEDKWSC
jgi:hypothetical protein